MNTDHRFIIVDDDLTSNLICQLTLELTLGKIDIKTFTNPQEGIKSRVAIYILSSSVDSRDKDRSYANKNVRNHLAKPLTNKVIHEIVQHETNQIPVSQKKGLFGKGK